MGLKHRVAINIANSKGRKQTVLKGAELRLPSRLVRFLFGDYTHIYLLKPGQSVESVNVKEIKEEGA